MWIKNWTRLKYDDEHKQVRTLGEDSQAKYCIDESKFSGEGLKNKNAF
jgi:hypothetical protein